MPEKLPGILKSMASLSRKRPPYSRIPRRWNGKTRSTPSGRSVSRDWESPHWAALLFWSIPTGDGRMAKKRFGSSPLAGRARKNAKLTRVEPIDFSDIPESTNEELKRARRVGRPKTGNAKQLIAIRISPRLLGKLRRLAAKRDKPYQTLIHELLEKAAYAFK